MAEVIVFGVAALIVLAGALGVILSRNPVHSALSLVGTLFGVAILFIAQGADFLAAVQVIVYAGAVVVLFLFVIMLLGVDQAESLEEDPLRGQRPAALFGGGVMGLLLILVLQLSEITGAKSTGAARDANETDVAQIGRLLFTDHLFAFEITSLLLVIGVVGAVMLTRSRRVANVDADEVDSDDPLPEPKPEDASA